MKNQFKRITLADIARKVGVSSVLVGKAVHGSGSKRVKVSEETARRIRQVARELGYVRNDAASSLVTGKTYTIGMVLDSMQTSFNDALIVGLSDLCYPNGYALFTTISEYDSQRELRNLQAMLAKRVDALIVNRCKPTENEEEIHQILSYGCPVVLIGGGVGPQMRCDTVAYDESRTADIAVEYALSMGHRRVLHFHATDSVLTRNKVHQGRWEYFNAAFCKKTGIAAVQGLSTADEINGGSELVQHLLKLPREQWPTAVVCSTDRLALSAINSLMVQNIRVPDDISVMGIDDIDQAKDAKVPLTTVRLPAAKMAQEIWDLLENRFQGPEAFGDPKVILIAPELVVRESVRQIVVP